MILHRVNRRKQAGKVFYSLQAPISVIFPHAVVKSFEEHMGFQRPRNVKKERSIAKYLKQTFWTCPEITLVCEGSVIFEPYDTRYPDFGCLHVPEFVVIDGQHRLNGAFFLFRKFKQSIDTVLDFKVYHHLDQAERIQVFVDLNKNLSKVTLSLIRFLTDDGFAATTTLKLIENTRSPFHGRVSIDGQRAKKLNKTITLESLVRCIETIDKSVKLSVLQEETRSYLIEHFFTAVQRELVDSWTSESRILNSYGVSFLGVVGREFMQECLHNGQLDSDRFQRLIRLLRQWDWNTQTRGTGAVSGSTDALEFLRKYVFNIRDKGFEQLGTDNQS